MDIGKKSKCLLYHVSLMRKNDIISSVRLSRRIFLSLIGVMLLSVVSMGFFWIEGKVTIYKKEVHLLTQTYSDTKKQEIKNKILEIKDYIQWIQYSSKKPITRTLSKQIDQLNLPEITTDKSGEGISEVLLQAFKDSVFNSRVPVYILNRKGDIIFAFNPFTGTGNTKLSAEEAKLLTQIKKSDEEKGAFSLYLHNDGTDSLLCATGYFNSRILPGFKVVSLIRRDYIDEVLQVHLLDSISRIRFSENEYVFINTLSGKALITHGKYNNPPVDILSSGDTAWISIFRAQQSSAAKPEGVFHKYTWALLAKPGSSGKTSYFSYIPTWQWIIGTGFYEDDVHQIIELRRKALYADLQRSIINILVFLLISTILCYLLVWFFSKQLGKNIDLFKTFFERAAKENHLIDKSQVTYGEFIFMAEAANLMVEERKQIEEALRLSEAHYRYLFEQNPVPLLIYELGSLRILSVNEAFSKHYGYNRDEALKMNITDLYTEGEREWVTELKKKTAGLAYSGEWHHIKKDGTLITVEINSHEFLHEGHSARIAVINDITNRKNVEDEIRILNANLEIKVDERTALLESANKELEAFSYSVSHDLRAPLRHVNGFLELLSKRNYQQLDDMGKHYIQLISSASNHMGVLIDNLLHFSRTGRMEMKLDNIDMNQVIREALTTLEEEANGRKIEWKIASVPDSYADYGMIRQVWVNLLSNAIKYTRKRENAIIEIGYINEEKENVFFCTG